jgi:hypothetical protein
VKRTCLLLLVALACRMAVAQQPAAVSLDPLKFLVGQWVGEGTAETQQAGAGSCSFQPDLQNKVLVRRNHAEYPAADGHPAIAHDDLMVIYPDAVQHQLRAFYTDNEGHVIHYTVTSDDRRAVFLGDAAPGQARYRLTYDLTQPAHMTVTLEIASPGNPDRFHKIIEGRMKRSDAEN